MQKTHEQSRAEMALRTVATLAMVARKRGMDPLEMPVAADGRDWHLYARLAGGRPDYTPSQATRGLVRNALREAAEVVRRAEAA
jgi:hypothetical protein